MTDTLGLEDAERLLVDSKAESRQKAVNGITQRAASLFREQPEEEACRTLLTERDRIQHFYLNATPAAYRRAGMIAVRAILSGLPPREFPEPVVRGYCSLVVPSVMDADPVVRMATTEALHEWVWRFSSQALRLCFAEFFRALTCAVGDADGRIRALAQEVSLAAKEIVSGNPRCPINPTEFAQFVEDTLRPLTYDAPKNVPHGGANAPHHDFALSRSNADAVVSWVLDWTLFALDTPGMKVVNCLPLFLPSLMRVASLSGAGTEGKNTSPVVASAALTVIRAAQRELRKATALSDVTNAIVSRVVVTLLSVLQASAGLWCAKDGQENSPDNGPLHTAQRFCLEWVRELALAATTVPSQDKEAGGELTVPCDEILKTVLPYLASPDHAVQKAAEATNAEVARIASSTAQEAGESPHGDSGAGGQELVSVVCRFLSLTLQPPSLTEGRFADERIFAAEAGCVGGLQWLALLLRIRRAAVEEQHDQICRLVVALLCGPSLTVSRTAAEVLCTLTKESPDMFEHAVAAVLWLTQADAARVLPRLPAVMKTLQLAIEDPASQQSSALPATQGCERLLVSVAATLSSMGANPSAPDVRFVSKCVVTLNAALLTSDEFSTVRATLRASNVATAGIAADAASLPDRSQETFLSLFSAWKYNAVSLLSLCLLSGQDEIAFEVCACIAASEPSAATLVQLDRLVQLLEGPVLAHVRMRLLRSWECRALVETLYAILMLLPQVSPQYDALHRRLSLVPALAQFQSNTQPHRRQETAWRPLLTDFIACQTRVLEAEVQALNV